MKLGELEELVAVAMRVPANHVHMTARPLREAGLLTSTGARGISAPDMTMLDAARLLIAHIVLENPGRSAPRWVQELGALPWHNRDFAWQRDPFTLQSLVPDASIATFELAIVALIRVLAECADDPRVIEAGTRLRDGGWMRPPCRIETAPSDGWARIRMDGRRGGDTPHEAFYEFGELRTLDEWGSGDDENTRLGRQSLCWVNQEVIAVIAEGFKAEVQ